MASRKGQPRIERDEFGEVTIPAGCYWGVRTHRAVENFATTGRPCHAALIEAMAQVKKAAAIANGESGLLHKKTVSAITQVCDEILSGQWQEQFVVDAFAGGGGVALVININEVIANRASEILGDQPDSLHSVNVDQHVNLSQSTNDVFITAMRVAILRVMRKFETTVLELERLLRRKSLEFERILKVGRIALRDSTPVTLGQEFNCYGSTVERALRRIRETRTALEEVNMGGRSVGTGYNTVPEMGSVMVRHLAQIAGLNLRSADDYFRLTQSMVDFVAASSSLRELAVDLIKIAADLRLMNSGPHAGFGEIKLPEQVMQASDLLPGVMPPSGIAPMTETLSMTCFQVMGNDHAVCLAAQSGQLESNTFGPAIVDNILNSVKMLQKAIDDFNHHCLIKITADNNRCKELFDKSGALIAALATELGYQKSLDIVEQASSQKADVREYVVTSKSLPRPALDKVLHYKFLTTPGLITEGTAPEDTGDDTR